MMAESLLQLNLDALSLQSAAVLEASLIDLKEALRWYQQMRRGDRKAVTCDALISPDGSQRFHLLRGLAKNVNRLPRDHPDFRELEELLLSLAHGELVSLPSIVELPAALLLIETGPWSARQRGDLVGSLVAALDVIGVARRPCIVHFQSITNHLQALPLETDPATAELLRAAWVRLLDRHLVEPVCEGAEGSATGESAWERLRRIRTVSAESTIGLGLRTHIPVFAMQIATALPRRQTMADLEGYAVRPLWVEPVDAALLSLHTPTEFRGLRNIPEITMPDGSRRPFPLRRDAPQAKARDHPDGSGELSNEADGAERSKHFREELSRYVLASDRQDPATALRIAALWQTHLFENRGKAGFAEGVAAFAEFLEDTPLYRMDPAQWARQAFRWILFERWRAALEQTGGDLRGIAVFSGIATADLRHRFPAHHKAFEQLVTRLGAYPRLRALIATGVRPSYFEIVTP